MSAANTPPPFEAYVGNEPFVFISYAHKDSEIVFSELSRIASWGIKVWYDEGIEAGSEWPKEIAGAIGKSSLFLYFVSARSVGSVHCRNEVYHALSLNKPFLCVHLEETNLVKLDEGLALSIGRLQAIHKNVLTDTIYQNKLKRSLQTLLGVPEEAAAQVAQPMPQPALPLPQAFQPLPQAAPLPQSARSVSQPARSTQPKGNNSMLVGLGLGAILFFLVAIGGLGGLTLFLKHPRTSTPTLSDTTTPPTLPVETVPTTADTPPQPTSTDTATPPTTADTSPTTPIVTTTTETMTPTSTPITFPDLTTNSDGPKVDRAPTSNTNSDSPVASPPDK